MSNESAPTTPSEAHSPLPDPHSPLRIVVMGTGPFAVPMFRALYGTRHTVVGLVTQPVRVVKGKAPPASPMRLVAEEHGTPIFDPPSINTDEARLRLAEWRPDLFVVADYGQILKPETLAVAPRGGINLHGSVLPKYRGAAPINWAIYHGDAETGVTVIEMSPRVDAGPCLAIARTPIGLEETAVELELRLATLGGPLVAEVVEQLASGQVQSLPQDPSLASPARRLRKSDAEIDWRRSAMELQRQVRAFEPWPRTSTTWLRKHGEPVRVILGRVRVGPPHVEHHEPGHVVAVDKAGISVAAGNFATGSAATASDATGATASSGLSTARETLVLEQLQPAGKRMMSAAEFLNGHPLAVGDRFGSIVE